MLSLALLRLTTETASQRVLAASVDSEEDELAISEEIENQRQVLRDWQKWLVDYLMRYCRRYGQRLNDVSFIHETGPELIFQNHYTLARVLLEFHEKTETFSSGHLREAVREIWAPLFGRDGVLNVLASDETVEIVGTLWNEASLTPVFVMILSKAWSEAFPGWDQRNRIQCIQRFIYARNLIEKSEASLGTGYWRRIDWTQVDWFGLRGFQSVEDLITDSLNVEHDLEEGNRFDQLAKYQTPIEQHYREFFHWHQLRKQGHAHLPETSKLAEKLTEQDSQVFSLIRSADRIVPIIGDSRECPVSYVELPSKTLADLRRGKLVPSPHIPRTLLFWKPAVDEQVLSLGG